MESFNFNKMIINKQNLIDNIKNFKLSIRKNIKFCAVVKADAYGHGVEGVISAINDHVDFYAVATINEALIVRKLTKKPILLLSLCEKESIRKAIQNDISLCIDSISYLKLLIKSMQGLEKNAKLHIKINTGMNRLGISKISEFENIIEIISKHKYLKLEGVYTHFFDSINKNQTKKQYKLFNKFLQVFDNKSICKKIKREKVIVHAGATNASIKNSKYCYDMARIGLLIYGYSDVKTPFILKPVMNISSTILSIKNIKKGEYIGYGKNYRAKKDMKVACVSMGYADGFLRSNSKNGKVIIMNKYAKIVGNICMDLFMIDVSEINCNIGDEVIILGSSKSKKINAENLAKINNTISYEILTNFRKERMSYIIK